LKPLFRLEGIELPEGADEWVGRLWPNVVSSIPATGKNLEALLSQLAG